MMVVFGILGILLLVVLHELGHFWAAKKSGIKVEEFGVGFPPRAKILGKKDGTTYTLNWLPLGGFVKLFGESDDDKRKGSYGAAKLWQKVWVMVAGVGMNLLAAWAIFTVVALFGMPQVIDGQYYVESDSKVITQDVVSAVIPDSAADKAGMKDYDVIRQISLKDCDQSTDKDCSVEIKNSEVLKETTRKFAGQEVKVEYQRGDENLSAVAYIPPAEQVEESYQKYDTCLSNGKDDCEMPKGYLGVIPSDYTARRSTWSAPVVGAVNTAQFGWATLKGVGGIVADLFRGNPGQAAQQTSGIVGVVYIFNQSTQLGIVFGLVILGLISVSLAVMNILPIPALDGGRLFVTLLFKALNKPLSKDLEEKIHGTGFLLLLILFVLITIIDVDRFIL